MLNKRQLQKLESAPDWHEFQLQLKRRTPEEWIAVAEQLAEDNGGKLHTSWWLIKNGYSGLDHAIRNNLELFNHIEQNNNKGRSPEEWVPIAVQLAKDNGGKLQNPKWLTKNGYSGLYDAMRKQPELFKHIEQESKALSPEEWVPIAVQLAKDNGGKLINPYCLQKNGYHGLAGAIKKRPELFSHIKQDKKGRSPKEWVPIAEQLVEDNGGKLPKTTWLITNKHYGLIQVMRTHPELFKHIERESKKGRSPEEWAAFAIQLSKDNGGKLPDSRWLKANNYYHGLFKAMRKHPELF